MPQKKRRRLLRSSRSFAPSILSRYVETELLFFSEMIILDMNFINLINIFIIKSQMFFRSHIVEVYEEKYHHHLWLQKKKCKLQLVA